MSPPKHPPDPPEWEVVLALAHGDRLSAICRDPDGSHWLVWNMADLANDTGWDDEPPEEGEEWDFRWELGGRLRGYETVGRGMAADGRIVIGGRLPEAAASVQVLDGTQEAPPVAVGAGLWLAAPEPTYPREPVVRFFDVDGRPVLPPLPAHVRVEPLADADVPCPVCGELRWTLVSVADTIDYDDASGEWPPGARAGRCGVCGYVQQLPGVIRLVSDPNAAPATENGLPTDEHRAWSAAVAELGTGPVGLSASWRGLRHVAGWGGTESSGPVTDMTLDHETDDAAGPRVTITTGGHPPDDPDLPPEEWIAENLVDLLSDRWRDDSLAADDSSLLREQLHRREVEAAVHAMEPRTATLPLDGTEVPFVVIGDDDAWVAYRAHGPVGITVAARRCPFRSIALETVEPGPYLGESGDA